jgi:hypothetical protein
MTKINVELGSRGSIVVDLDAMFTNSNASREFENIWAESTALRYIVQYGFKQSLNDAHATMTKKSGATDAIAMSAVDKRLDAIMSGTVKQAGTRQVRDPVGAEANRLAWAFWHVKTRGNAAYRVAAIAKARAMLKMVDADEKDIVRAIVASLAAQPSRIDEARANIERANEDAATSDIDLDELFGSDEEEAEQADFQDSDNDRNQE